MGDGFVSLADFIRSGKGSGSEEQFGLTRAVAEHLEKKEDSPGEGFHVSSLFRFCPVKWVLSKILKKPDHIPYQLRYRFDIGHALHAVIQGYLADMGILYGYWRCENGHETDQISLKPEKCSSCESTRIRYREIRIEHEVAPGHKVVGRPDGIIRWEDENLGIEIKSVQPEALLKISRPFDYPMHQIRIYMHLLRFKRFFPEIRRGMVLYVAASGDAAVLPIKTFNVDYSEVPWNESLSKILKAIELLEAYRSRKLGAADLISSRICATKSNGRKIECPYVSECFDESYLDRLSVSDGVRL